MTTICPGALDLGLALSVVSVVVRPTADYGSSVIQVTSNEVTAKTTKRQRVSNNGWHKQEYNEK